MKTYLFLIIVAIVVGFSACRNDNVIDLYEPVCDTITTYSGFVLPLLEDKCFECHGTETFATEGEGKLLEGYDNLMDFVGDDSTFIRSIRHDDGVVAMPDGSDKLSNCNISKIEKWIANGAPNN